MKNTYKVYSFQVKEIRVGLESFSLGNKYEFYATEGYQMKKNQHKNLPKRLDLL